MNKIQRAIHHRLRREVHESDEYLKILWQAPKFSFKLLSDCAILTLGLIVKHLDGLDDLEKKCRNIELRENMNVLFGIS
jgi:hypothetical protein